MMIQNIMRWAQRHDRSISVTEAQAEPWESTIVPHLRKGRASFSCQPEDAILYYNKWMAMPYASHIGSYMFWGLEYCIRKAEMGDLQHLEAIKRILHESA